MKEEIANPLLKGDLERAVLLCLLVENLANYEQFSPKDEEKYRREHQERKRRFEQAKAMMKKGTTNLLELGLLPRDCEWAAGKTSRTIDEEEWRYRFQAAANKLRTPLTALQEQSLMNDGLRAQA